jgi:hypothetical protein
MEHQSFSNRNPNIFTHMKTGKVYVVDRCQQQPQNMLSLVLSPSFTPFLVMSDCKCTPSYLYTETKDLISS